MIPYVMKGVKKHDIHIGPNLISFELLVKSLIHHLVVTQDFLNFIN